MKSNNPGEILESDYLEMAEAVYIDATAKCIADVSDLRDLITIRARVESEGFSFLTITLPAFCDDFERSLARGSIDPTAFRNFRKSGAIPAFLQGMLGQIFNRETGELYEQSPIHDSDTPTIIDSVRQICLVFKKVEVICSPTRVARTLSNFARIEQTFKSFSVPMEAHHDFRVVASVLWSSLVANISIDELRPRHGPGTTAEGITGNSKYQWQYWYDRLEPFFPLLTNAYCLSAYESEEIQLVTVVKPEQERPVRVVLVPKTLKGPRVIAIEPCCVQFTQQAIRAALYRAIESSDIVGGQVNFTDRTANQQLAISSSKDGQLATIDLSDASDRVPRDLALEMFRSNPDLQDAIDACRSKNAELPDGTLIGPLSKFASMGSALCFPVESMYFYTICVVALLKAQKLPVTRPHILNVCKRVHVYGDDIVVPSAYAIVVLDYLQKYNCKVNMSKTFVTGKFRESCGMDAYDGEQVTPVYLRKVCPKNKRQAAELISWVASGNLFYKKGYWHTAQFMFNKCERILGPLPYVSDTSSVLGRISFLGYRSTNRWNDKLQRLEVRGWVPSPVYRADRLEGYAALTKCLMRLEDRESDLPSTEQLSFMSEDYGLRPILETDPRHLERSALRGAVALNRRWAPA